MEKRTFKKPIKLNIIGLIKIECENWSLKEVLAILALVMIFVLGVFFLLKTYAIPALGGVGAVNSISGKFLKYFKTRAP